MLLLLTFEHDFRNKISTERSVSSRLSNAETERQTQGENNRVKETARGITASIIRDDFEAKPGYKQPRGVYVIAIVEIEKSYAFTLSPEFPVKHFTLHINTKVHH